MEERIIQFLIPLTGLLAGLVGAYVGLQNRALLAEVRREIAEIENQIFVRINGQYVRSGECKLRGELVNEKLTAIAEAMKGKNAAGD